MANETFDVRDDRFDDDEDDLRPVRRRKEGWSTGAKILVGILAVGGLSLVVCCGGVIFMGNRFVKDIKDNFTEDPVRIAEIREEITTITVPESLPPQAAGLIKIPFGLFSMHFVMHGGEQQAMLMLMQMQSSQMPRADMEKSFRQQASNQGSGHVQIVSSEPRTFTINGEECDFLFAQGKLTGDVQIDGQAIDNAGPEPAAEAPPAAPEAPAQTPEGAEVAGEAPADAPAAPPAENAATNGEKLVRQVSGMFPGRDGTAFLLLIVPEKDWNEEEVVKMIESIHN